MSDLKFKEEWLDELIALRSVTNKEFVKDVVWDILNYGIKGNYSEDSQESIDYVCQVWQNKLNKNQSGQRGVKAKYNHDKMFELYRQGYSIYRIAKEIGCSYPNVVSALKKYKANENGSEEI